MEKTKCKSQHCKFGIEEAASTCSQITIDGFRPEQEKDRVIYFCMDIYLIQILLINKIITYYFIDVYFGETSF